MIDSKPRSHLDDYELQAKLGSGTVGEVWRALSNQHVVAIKFINQPDDKQQRKSIETEINALRCLDHPAVPTLYDFDLDCDRPHIIMEYVEGEPFHRMIADGSIWQIPVERRLSILDQVAQAAAHLHAHGLIHRDIKPANIIGIDAPHLIDYGIAVEIGAQVSPAGTPFYVCPDDQPPTITHDLFGFALTAYEFLFGVHAIFTAQDGGLARDEVRALARQRLADRLWRLPSQIAAHELPYDLRGVDLARLDALFARSFDWNAAEPIPLADLVAELRASILTPENQPFRDAMPQVAAPLESNVSDEVFAKSTVHPESALRLPNFMIVSVILICAAILFTLLLQNVS